MFKQDLHSSKQDAYCPQQWSSSDYTVAGLQSGTGPLGWQKDYKLILPPQTRQPPRIGSVKFYWYPDIMDQQGTPPRLYADDMPMMCRWHMSSPREISPDISLSCRHQEISTQKIFPVNRVTATALLINITFPATSFAGKIKTMTWLIIEYRSVKVLPCGA